MEHPIAAAFQGYTPLELPLGDLKPSAVMLLLAGGLGDERIVFQLRTHTVRHHKGEISLPGGRRDPEDTSFLHTALRETEEEVGVPREAIHVLGALDDVETVASSHLIRPYVGLLSPSVTPRIAAAREVRELLHVPLAHLRDERSRVWKVVEEAGAPVPTAAYEYEGHLIWGATARILGQFLDLTQSIDLRATAG